MPAFLDSRLGIVGTEFRTVGRERQMAGLIIDEEKLGPWARLPLSARSGQSFDGILMKRLLIALSLCAPFSAGSAEVKIACIGPESDDCPMAMDLNADMEALVATFDDRSKPDGSVERVTLAWTYIVSGAPLQWGPATSAATLYGKSRPLNGELTRRQMAQVNLVFETMRSQASCRMDEQTPRCAATPLFPAQPDKVAISCIGGIDSGDCPVAVDVRLDNERLTAAFQLPKADGSIQFTVLEWCGIAAAGGQPRGWFPFGQQSCAVSGTYRVLDGELNKRQLAQGYMRFTTRKVEAFCALNSSNAAVANAVCMP